MTKRPWYCPKRPPDLVIGTAGPYLERWCLLPFNRFFNIYIHHFVADDDPRALHDHPWVSLSIQTRGVLREILDEWHSDAGEMLRAYRVLHAPAVTFRWPTTKHRLELVSEDAWTIFFVGPRVREWGFHCPQGWRHWREFVNPDNHGAVGRGCE